MTSYIYKITEAETGLIYIGQSKDEHNLNIRWRCHEKKWPGSHKEVIITCPFEDLNELEMLMIETFDSHRNGLNKTIGGAGIRCKFQSEDTKRKRSKAQKGKPCKSRGRKLTDEQKKHLSEKLKGKPAPNKGRPMSEESKQRLSENLKGKNKGRILPKTACQHCGKLCDGGNLKRHHNDNCKMKEKI